MITALSLRKIKIRGALSIIRRKVKCNAGDHFASTGIINSSQREEQALSEDIAEYTIQPAYVSFI